jgi:hypothetical protein
MWLNPIIQEHDVIQEHDMGDPDGLADGAQV